MLFKKLDEAPLGGVPGGKAPGHVPTPNVTRPRLPES